jgi:hypothetical protein
MPEIAEVLTFETASAPAYEAPTITVLSDEEVLRAFQMTAAQIGAAATWWSTSCSAC